LQQGRPPLHAPVVVSGLSREKQKAVSVIFAKQDILAHHLANPSVIRSVVQAVQVPPALPLASLALQENTARLMQLHVGSAYKEHTSTRQILQDVNFVVKERFQISLHRQSV